MSQTDALPGAPAAALTAPPHLVRFAVDSDDEGSLFPADFVRTYSDLVTSAGALAALRDRFPDSTVELIDRGLGDPTKTATIANIEPGALTPAQGAGRIRTWHAEGRHHLVAYCDRALLPEVVQACDGLPYWHWIAAWGEMVVPSHRDAQVQFADSGMLGIHADLTVVWNPAYRPRTAAALPAVTVGPLPPREASIVDAMTAAGRAAAAGEPPAGGLSVDLARLSRIFTAAQARHGKLAILEHDMGLLFDAVADHQNMLAELASLLP